MPTTSAIAEVLKAERDFPELDHWLNESMSRSSPSFCSPRSTVDSAKVREWMHALPWSPQWDWLREEMAAAIGEPSPSCAGSGNEFLK
jgi:hypothetical protein